MRVGTTDSAIVLEAVTQSMLVLDREMKIVGISGSIDAEIENRLLSQSINTFCPGSVSLLDDNALVKLQKNGFLRNKLVYCNGIAYEASLYTICNTITSSDHYTLFIRKRSNPVYMTSEILRIKDIDLVTKLPNRAYLLDLLQQKTSMMNKRQKSFALLFIEFDDLRIFNESSGLEFDDQLILQLGQAISAVLNRESMLTSVGNQQFVVIAEDTDIVNSVEQLAKKILHLFNEPFIVNTTMFYVSASIGISLFPLDAVEPYSLLKMAEDTMLNVQKDGKNYFALTQHIDISLKERRRELMADLPVALENGEIYFLYQCQYDYAKKYYSGVEMLARWKHPRFGEISPSIFIPLAEQSGMIGPLTVKGLIEASKLLNDLEEIGAEDFSVSVNISPLVLMKSDFLETIEFFMGNYNLNRKPLNFEITEEMFTGNLGLLTQILEKLRHMGISIEIDDFGTGFTSLTHLAYLPVDTLKVDRSFVTDIHNNAKYRTLFKAIVEMSRALEIEVIAEGVENSEEDTVLQEFGAIKVQGFFYSKPMTHQVLLAKLTE